MTPNLVLWVYIVLLMAGGLIGFLKAKSKASLIASAAFALALALCQFPKPAPPYVADILLAALLVVFVIRFNKGRKFMPSGLMIILTVLALVLRQVI